MAVINVKLANPYYVPGVADFSQPYLWVAAAMIVFNPLYWNIVAQNEYRNKTITKLLGNKPRYGCYLLGASIFLLGIVRDHLYNVALSKQPVNGVLALPAVKYLGALLFVVGQTFVLSSMYALGFTGTYLGDYFGILMDSIVTGFPFNVISDPMYWGSSLCFVGVALWYGKPAGLLLSTLVVIVYAIALRFEGPFTANIYAQAAKKKKSSVSRRGSTASTTGAKRAASTSRRKSTAAAKKEASADGDSTSSTTTATKKRATANGTPARKRKDSTASVKSTKSVVAAAGADSATGTPAATPAKRGRKKKVAAA